MKENQDSRNMLHRFTCRGDLYPMKPNEEHGRSDDVVELSLGLSLNGRFGPDPQRSVTDDDNNIIINNISKVSYPLTRTSSLPPETAAEWRRRQQLQSLRRLEAKRKRVEKLKNVRMVKGKKEDEQSLPSPPPAAAAGVVQCSSFDDTMPCVSTKGGKRIRGFLYRYGEDEEVRIVCVCHGSFLTPVEFVKHGGGGEVENPLRHILVTSLFS